MFFYDWEQRKLGDEVTFFSGLSYSPDNIVESGSTLVLRSSNVKNGEIVDADNVYVENEAVNSDNVQVGDVIVVVRNGSRNLIGKHAQIKKEMDDTVIGAFMTGVRSDTPYFINALLDTEQFTREIYKNLGATINQITTGAFKKMQFVVPKNKTEQEQIGNFFKQIDDTIALHQRKLDKLKQLKQGYLQQMFPKSGESVPKIRFANFEGVWEKRKLEDIIISEIKGKAKAEMYGTASPYLETNYLNGGEISYVNSPKNVDEDDVIILWDGSQAGTVYHGFKGALGSTLKAYSPKESGKFLYQYLKLKQQVIYDSYRTPNIPHVIKTFAKEFNVHFTCYEEQNKIGILLNQLDETTALYQSKIDKLKLMKKGFLQKMFI